MQPRVEGRFNPRNYGIRMQFPSCTVFMAAFCLLSISLMAIYNHAQLKGKEVTPHDGVTTTTGLFESWNDFYKFLNSDKPTEFSKIIQLPW